MNTKENETSQSTSTISQEQNQSSSEFFIDDYSQLRLSYYQVGPNSTIGASTDDSNTSAEDSCNTLETQLSEASIVDAKEAERQKLRDYYISQIPDLPHPSYTVASIIASASRKMGSVHLRYNDRIEQGDQLRDTREKIEFSPQRRSTLKPAEFPKSPFSS